MKNNIFFGISTCSHTIEASHPFPPVLLHLLIFNFTILNDITFFRSSADVYKNTTLLLNHIIYSLIF